MNYDDTYISKTESFNMIIWFAELSTRSTLSAVMFG